MNPLDSFGKTAQKLATNPLGIIALFIVLVYGIAGFVFSSSAQYLDCNQKSFMIAFLVLFPVLVLSVFVWLVTCHHVKLYAPSDFKDEKNFMDAFKTAGPEQVLQKVIAENAASVGDDNTDMVTPATLGQTEPTPSFSREELLGRQNVAVSNYLQVENMAINEIESEFDSKALRHVSFTNGGVVDGLMQCNANIYVIEVKYIRRMNLSEKLFLRSINGIIKMVRTLPEFYHGRTFIILAVVVEKEVSAQYIDKLRNILPNKDIPIIFKCFRHEELVDKYG